MVSISFEKAKYLSLDVLEGFLVDSHSIQVIYSQVVVASLILLEMTESRRVKNIDRNFIKVISLNNMRGSMLVYEELGKDLWRQKRHWHWTMVPIFSILLMKLSSQQ